jgi:hypothetical protein
MGVIHSVRPYFLKLYVLVRIHVYAHIRTIIVSTCVKLTGFYFLHLLPIIYFSVTTHLCPGKKIRYATD